MGELTKKIKRKPCEMAKMDCVWAIEDDLLLRDMFDDGDDIPDMALMLKRTEPTVHQRIDQLDLYSKHKRIRKKNEIPPAACVKTARRTKAYVPAASIIPEIRRNHDV